MTSGTGAAVLRLALSRPPTLGPGRLICIDGPAGSGKTTLAAAVAARAGAPVVHLDDVYDGWSGLPRLGDRLEGLLRPLASGTPGTYRRYDWVAGELGETVTVPPTPLIVLEGVGAGSVRHADLVTVLVWVQAPREERLRRGLARDGAAVEPQWRRWMAAEAAYLHEQGTAARADIAVDGCGRLLGEQVSD